MVRDASKYPRFKVAEEALIKRGALNGPRTFTRVYFRTCAATTRPRGERHGVVVGRCCSGAGFDPPELIVPSAGERGSASLDHGTRRRLCCGEGLGASDRVARFVSLVGRPSSHATCPSPTEAPAMAGPLILPKVAGGQRRLCSHRFPLDVQSRPFRAGGTGSVLWNRVQQTPATYLLFAYLVGVFRLRRKKRYNN